MAELLRPSRGGFLRPFGCGWFICEFLLGNSPYDSNIDPDISTPQTDIFHFYKEALRRESAMDQAVRTETKQAKRQKRPVHPDAITSLQRHYLARMPYKANGCRYHSFVIYFSNLQQLGRVEPSSRSAPSAFQGIYPPVPPRGYCRLNVDGSAAPDSTWANPLLAHCG